MDYCGPSCLEVPDWQIHEYNPNLGTLRESGRTNFAKSSCLGMSAHQPAMAQRVYQRYRK